MNCDHFDPITASCAPCCIVCSNYGTSCHGERKAAPVLAHKDGSVKQTCERPIPHLNFTQNQEVRKYEF